MLEGGYYPVTRRSADAFLNLSSVFINLVPIRTGNGEVITFVLKDVLEQYMAVKNQINQHIINMYSN